MASEGHRENSRSQPGRTAPYPRAADSGVADSMTTKSNNRQKPAKPEILEQPPAEDTLANDTGLTRPEQDELAWVRSILDDVQMGELYAEAHGIAVRQAYESEAGERG